MEINTSKIKAFSKAVVSKTLLISIVVYLLFGLMIGASGILIVTTFILYGAIMSGYSAFLLENVLTKNGQLETLFSGFKNFTRNMLLGLLHMLYIMLWSMLFVIPGIIKNYSYSMSYFIGEEFKKMSGNDCITHSRKMMDGHKMQLFIMDLSFIGWILLSALTFGILLYWVMPYMQTSRATFYKMISEKYYAENGLTPDNATAVLNLEQSEQK